MSASKPNVLFRFEGGVEGATSHTFWDYLLTENEILRVKIIPGSEFLSKAVIGAVSFPVTSRSVSQQMQDLERSRRSEAAQLPVEELFRRGIADRIPWSRVVNAEIRPVVKFGPYALGRARLFTIRWNGKKVTFPITKQIDVEKLREFLSAKIGERLKEKG